MKENKDGALRLRRLGEESARALGPLGESTARRTRKELRRSLSRCDQIRRQAARRWQGREEECPGACRWLLDNWYLARGQALCALRELEGGTPLRRSGEKLLLLSMAEDLLQTMDWRFSEEGCQAFLEGFQAVTPLRLSELERLPAALRSALLGHLAQLCEALLFAQELRPFEEKMEAVFSSLRLLSVLEFEPLLRISCVTGVILAEDPAGVYEAMDRDSRLLYLRRLAKLARRQGLEEPVYARRLLEKAREAEVHVGALLFSPPPRWPGGLYMALNLLGTAALSLTGALALHSAAAGLLLLLPVSELTKKLLDLLLSRHLPQRRLPRIDTEKGLPPEGRSLCVLSCLLGDEEEARQAAGKLEQLRLLCRSEGPELRFGLLADLPEAETETTDRDGAVLSAAQQAVHRLNRRYGGGFYLFTRPRRFDGERWSAPGRKRGAITALMLALRDRENELRIFGDRDALAGTRFVLTLDSDTRLSPGTAGALIGTMLHPLCRPVVDEKRRVVCSGYGVLQPRLCPELESANETDFALVFAGAGGSDPYGAGAGERNMDAFGRTGFSGKGLLDVDAYLRCTLPHIQESAALSHDTLEAACLRGALVAAGEAADAFPARPAAYYRRLHRWLRGDWQNLPYLFHREFDALDRFRLFDALRLSLLPPMTLAAILAGFLLPGPGARLSAWAALLSITAELAEELGRLALARRSRPRLRRRARLLTGVGGALIRSFLRLWLLPAESWVCLSAMLTALWRRFVSKKRLLQWQVAARGAAGQRFENLRLCLPGVLLGAALLCLPVPVLGRSAGLLWLLSPLTAAALALPSRKERSLSGADRAWLTEAVRPALHYFLDLCSPEDHGLPPDNFQTQPPRGAAHRSSPTNMGLALLSFAAGAELGLIEKSEASVRMERMLQSLEELKKHRGHLFNWYDTRTLRPLEPAVLSTVDSGNLCACLLTAEVLLEGWGEEHSAWRCKKLAAEMDFALLFDRRRGLFYISYDPEKERGVGGWYDLMASEAMLTSYLAIARGEIPARHWQRLGRGQLQKDGFRGLASWTGTMFEYLMPLLFLPLYPGSLLEESARFCLYAQKRRCLPGKPWGVSESAYNALDSLGFYRYKAHGAAALALKRGQDQELVVSPYSSFLALVLDGAGAVRNLRRLKALGLWGRWGFPEAIDFSPDRGGEDGAVVGCYMAHHVGMSVLAAANALQDGCITRAFFSRPEMAAFRLLLQERLPEDRTVLKKEQGPVPRRERQQSLSPWRQEGPAEISEERCLLSNGVYRLQIQSSGAVRALWGQVLVYQQAEAGAAFDRWRFDGREAAFYGQGGALSLCTAAAEAGELRRFEAGAVLTLRMVLAGERFALDHPAYWRLGLEQERRREAFFLRRLPRRDQAGLWLCLLPEGEFSFDFEPGRCLLRIAAKAPGHLALCLGRERDEALSGARRILEYGESGAMVPAAAARLGLDGTEVGAAMALLKEAGRPLALAAPRRELWPWGISGDRPLLCCDGDSRELTALLRRWLLLKSCGEDWDLAVISREEGEYRRPVHALVSRSLRRLGLEALLGAEGGVHLVPESAAAAVKSRALWYPGMERSAASPLPLPVLSRERRGDQVPALRWEGDSVRFTLRDDLPPRAWQQMLSGERLGAIVTETGLMALWLENARELPLLAGNPGPFDVFGPAAVWAETEQGNVSLFGANDGRACAVRYAPGLAEFEKLIAGQTVRLTVFPALPEEALVLRIEGAAGLRLGFALSPSLGSDPSSLRCGQEDGFLRAENPECPIPGTVLRLACSEPYRAETDFLPPAWRLRLRAGECTVLALGCGGKESLQALCDSHRAKAALGRGVAFWRRSLGPTLRTGSAALDRYLNHWCPYQALACRLMGRASLYQRGGAYGFRDQLQDAVNLLPLDRERCRRRIRDAARHQYLEGDVMHWWHPNESGDWGLRSRCSDDLLWLCWALTEYFEATGDGDFCRLEEPWLSSAPLGAQERDRYERAAQTPERASLLRHAEAALERCVARGFGAHGLPFFLSGDWNDAMDEIDGESAWLGWFLLSCAEGFAGMLEALGEGDPERWRSLAAALRPACEKSFNGRFYRRGYWSNGESLGGEERIDLLPQAWAALCGAEHSDAALDAAIGRLVDERHRLVKLFDPPYTDSEPSVGSIVGYGPGLRENGGQYSHAGVWLALALLKQGRRSEAVHVLELLLPEGRDPLRYGAEPYVLSADVSAAPGREGEAGWTWYTGSAGWFYRCGRALA